MQSLSIRVSESTSDTLTLPEPTMTRVITSTLNGNYIECIYWLDTYITSQKQFQWIADIKARIMMFIPEVEFVTYDKKFNYTTESGESYTLKQLSDTWIIATKSRPDIVIKHVQLPPLPIVDTMLEKDSDKAIMRAYYQPLMIHAKNLYYYHSFSHEAVYSSVTKALLIMHENLSTKNKQKLANSIYKNFSKYILENPHKLKQKLLGMDKEKEVQLRTKKLKSARATTGAKSIEANKSKILEAIESNPLCTKPNGTYNTTAIASVTNLHRRTVSRILKGINTIK